MKSLVFISDLDGTILYSGYPAETCVEYRGSEEITYMTSRAYSMFTKLLEKDEFSFIPCTLRSIEQTSRVSFVKDGKVEWAICDNGFSIYRKGVLDAEWDSMMRKEVAGYPNEAIYQELDFFANTHHTDCRIKDNRFAFFTLIFKDAELAHQYFPEVVAMIGISAYKFELQGRKLYIVPKFLDKSLAVTYLLRKFRTSMVVTAGDTSVDERFIQYGDVILIPKHARIMNPSAIITENEKIKAGEDIITKVVDCFDDLSCRDKVITCCL